MATRTAPAPSVDVVPVCAEPHTIDPAGLSDVRARLLGGRAIESVAAVFKLLGDPTRVRLVDALTHGERCVCDLAALVGMSESAISHQLRLLRSARLVRVRRVGRMAYYALDDHHVVGLLHDTRKHVQEERAPEDPPVIDRPSKDAPVTVR